MKKLIILSAITLASFNGFAEVRINGFANLVGGITSSGDILNTYDDTVSFDQDSLFALQVSGDINSKMTATGQIVARGNNDYSAEFEWAYITYQASDNTSVSAGRLRLPLFKYSSSKDVGYSYHWVTTPGAVYDVPFNNLDGIRVDYSSYSGDWEFNLQGAYGTYSSETGDGKVDGSNVFLFSAEAAYEWFKIRAVVGQGENTFDSASLDQTLSLLTGAGLNDLANDLAIVDDTGTFIGFGVDIDNFDYFISAEFTEVNIKDSFSPKDVAFYVTAGMRLDKFTPSITYEKLDGNQSLKYLDKVAALPEAYQASVGAVVVGLQQAFMDEYDVITLGLRYDFDTNVAFKADLSKYSDELNSSADATLMRVAVNYIF